MAEAFGAAAGVLSVVSLSIQLVESIQKVKNFGANIKQAGPRLEDLVKEIQQTCDVIRELEHGTQSTGTMTTPLVYKCMSSSRQAVENFAKVVSELEAYTKKKRIRGGLRFAFSQEEIAKMLTRMERAKGLLATACVQHQIALQDQQHALQQQQYALQQQQFARQQQQYDEILQAIIRLASAQANMGQRMELLFTTRQPEGADSDLIRLDCSKRRQRLFKLRIPEWMYGKMWQLALDISICGWQFTMRTYGVVSQSAPIIKACQMGDTVAMQRLFDTGAASPFDQTSDGVDLVSYSILSADINTIRFLLGHGITSNKRPVSYGLFWTCSLLQDRDDVTIHSDVQSLRGQYDEENIRTKEDLCYDKVAKSLELSSREEAVSLRFWRGVYHCRLAAFNDARDSSSIASILDSYEPSHLSGRTQLQLLAVVYGRAIAEWLHHEPPLSERPNDGLEVFILQAVRSGLDLHEGLNEREGPKGYTPLKAMLSAFCCFWDQGNMVPQSKLHKALITWLRLLERGGVDLCEYGKQEMYSFELHGLSNTPESMFLDWYHDVIEDRSPWMGPGTMLPLALSLGSRPSGWRIALLGFAEECSREFWQLEDAQANEVSYDDHVLPGAWIES